jgi:hypothetical protein
VSKTEPGDVPAPDDVYGVDRLCKDGCRRKSEILWSAYVRPKPVKCWSTSYSLSTYYSLSGQQKFHKSLTGWVRNFPGITPGVYFSVHGEVANSSAG